MIWFKLKKLETKLAHSEVSEDTALQYLLSFLVLFAIIFTLPNSDRYSGYSWEISEFILDLLITVVGARTVFSINQKGDNREFLKRFLSLSFVNGARLLIVLMPLWLVYKIIMYVIPQNLFLFLNDLFSGDTAGLLFSLALSLIFYLLLIRSFKRVNGDVKERENEVITEGEIL